MSATELEEVQALLERVLPDPRGFAGRLLQQAVTQYGLVAEPAPTAFYAAEDVTSGEDVIVADQWAADQPPVDTNILLAAALGACECWGLRGRLRSMPRPGLGRLDPAGSRAVRRVCQARHRKAARHTAPGSQAARPAGN